MPVVEFTGPVTVVLMPVVELTGPVTVVLGPVTVVLGPVDVVLGPVTVVPTPLVVVLTPVVVLSDVVLPVAACTLREPPTMQAIPLLAPCEVDEVLMDHPAVQQVVTFAVPHAKLGEEVAAAIVLREGMAADEREIREFAARRLADFKVPRTVVILAEIPKGATGKLQRIGLAQKLGLGS